MNFLELYAGIGGFSAALDAGSGQTVTAVDIDRTALEVYRANFSSHRTIAAEISTRDLSALGTHFWWLSPPCRPFTRRGHGRDIDDPRCASFLSLVDRLHDHRPAGIGLENVPPFADSVAAARLRRELDACGYAWQESMLCPTQLGVPMRRKRFYLLAVRKDVADDDVDWLGAPAENADASAEAQTRRGLGEFLDPPGEPAERVPRQWLDRYARAIDVVDADDSQAIASCFTAAYGRSPVRSGSYVREAGRVRFFRPREIARLMGFGETFVLPHETRAAYRLLGNSLAVPVVRRLLRPVMSLWTSTNRWE